MSSLERDNRGNPRFCGCSSIRDFEFLGKLGEGTFGYVLYVLYVLYGISLFFIIIVIITMLISRQRGLQGQIKTRHRCCCAEEDSHA